MACNWLREASALSAMSEVGVLLVEVNTPYCFPSMITCAVGKGFTGICETKTVFSSFFCATGDVEIPGA